ncbi:MAG: mechanosensitive ion channel [Alphaproteobacteria bacterium]|nr:mechanosensitive ion channel [Alphaproteobacteria bacterium]MCB9930929.1 mechanosensitive ion channel [Alphaproteobacteria bacterium]
MDSLLSQLGLEHLSDYAPMVLEVLKALAILVVGWIIAGAVGGFIKRRITASKSIDATLGSFFGNLVRWVILIAVFSAVLDTFGIQATSLVAVLGAATLAIGLALQGTLGNLAAGVMLIVFRPYRIGQFVSIGGTAGTVKDLDIFVTELATPDNVQIIIPNGQAWGAIITNFSAHPTRRVDLTFGIDYDDDHAKAIQIILDVIATDERAHADPAPWVRLTNLGESSVDLGVRVWCNAADYWELKFALTQKVKEAFDSNGITIPYPHRVQVQKSA